MRILGSSRNNNQKLPVAQQAPECPKHGVMKKEGNIYVCRMGCFSTDQRS